MQGRECGEGMSKSETGLRSLSQGSQVRVWNGEGRAGSSMRSSENRTKVCGWMGYAVGDLRTSLGHGGMWIGVLVQCYFLCNRCVASVTKTTRGFHLLTQLMLSKEHANIIHNSKHIDIDILHHHLNHLDYDNIKKMVAKKWLKVLNQ